MNKTQYRNDLIFFATISGFAGLLCGALLSFGLNLISDSNAPSWALLGTISGAAIAVTSTWLFDRRTRARELRDLKASLYAEIADRAARCVSDYMGTLKVYHSPHGKTRTPATIAKFKPGDPVVYPSVARELGRLEAHTILAVTHFYYRLDAYAQQIDFIVECNDDTYDALKILATRLQHTLKPALEALKFLDSPDAAMFDAASASVYDHLSKYKGTLRDALNEFALNEDAMR